MVPLNEAVYRAFIQQEDLTLEEARTLIASLLGSAQPNKQVVGVREFMLSPYYMNAVNADGIQHQPDA